MSALAGSDFVKMNGLGNEIVIVDLRRDAAARSRPARRARPRARSLTTSSWRFIRRMAAADASIRIYNNDGSEAGACGNGMRCVAALVSAETGKAKLNFETAAGLVSCWRAGEGLFTVDMGAPRFRWDEIPLAKRNAGYARNRSCIRAARRADLALAVGGEHGQSARDLLGRRSASLRSAPIGPLLEHHPLFPERANITLAATPSRDRVVIRTWERGAGLTKACGSAACAAAVAAARLDRTGRKVTVTLPGGDLAIEWREADDHVLMTGPVEYEHDGRFDAALFAGAGAA